VSSEIEPFDVLALLPPALGKDVAQGMDPKARSVLHDERGKSRMRRISVLVEWDEAGQPASVERITFGYDPAAIADLFPGPAPQARPGDRFHRSGESELEKVRKLAPPELRSMIPGGQPSGRSSSRVRPR